MNAHQPSQISPTSSPAMRSPSIPVLRRNRRLLIAGIITILPSAAVLPSLLAPSKSPELLAAVDQMTTSTTDAARSNERAVELASAKRSSSDAKPQATASAHLGTTASDRRESAVRASADDQSSTNGTAETRYFNGRPVRAVRTISMLVTAYSPDAQSCGDSADGITASGYSVWTNGMKMVAADTSILPFGTLVSVPGYDEANLVPVLDRGGAIKGNRMDVLYPTHERAMQWGVQRLEVTVWEYADGQPGDFQIATR